MDFEALMLKKLGRRVAPMNVQLNPEPDLNPGPKKRKRKQTPVKRLLSTMRKM